MRQARHREPLSQKPIYKPPPGPNDISVFSKSNFGRSLSHDKAGPFSSLTFNGTGAIPNGGNV